MSKHRSPAFLPMMMADLAISSWDTIASRTSLMMQGKCSPEEYQRMMTEKAEAAQASWWALMSPRGAGVAGALAPWLRRSKANARRLRKS